ncbi:Com family DNA-binding transcriptional regulator [Frederiksenia canicola]
MGKYMQQLTEIRCKCCNKLLAKGTAGQRLQIKCTRCKALNNY